MTMPNTSSPTRKNMMPDKYTITTNNRVEPNFQSMTYQEDARQAHKRRMNYNPMEASKNKLPVTSRPGRFEDPNRFTDQRGKDPKLAGFGATSTFLLFGEKVTISSRDGVKEMSSAPIGRSSRSPQRPYVSNMSPSRGENQESRSPHIPWRPYQKPQTQPELKPVEEEEQARPWPYRPSWHTKPAENPAPPGIRATGGQETGSAPRNVEFSTNQRPLTGASPKEGTPK